MYNHDVIGTRHNVGETAIGPKNASQLEEKWRFPAKGSGQEIGVIHATPIVVNGYVYFGTASAISRFYKLTPDGQKAHAEKTAEWSRFVAGVSGVLGGAHGVA